MGSARRMSYAADRTEPGRHGGGRAPVAGVLGVMDPVLDHLTHVRVLHPVDQPVRLAQSADQTGFSAASRGAGRLLLWACRVPQPARSPTFSPSSRVQRKPVCRRGCGTGRPPGSLAPDSPWTTPFLFAVHENATSTVKNRHGWAHQGIPMWRPEKSAEGPEGSATARSAVPGGGSRIARSVLNLVPGPSYRRPSSSDTVGSPSYNARPRHRRPSIGASTSAWGSRTAGSALDRVHAHAGQPFRAQEVVEDLLGQHTRGQDERAHVAGP